MKRLILALLLSGLAQSPQNWEEDCERIQPQDPAIVIECDRHVLQIEGSLSGKMKVTVRSFLER